jgi:hypothetical protein
MTRRKFLTLLVGAVATWPQSVRAQSEPLQFGMGQTVRARQLLTSREECAVALV